MKNKALYCWLSIGLMASGLAMLGSLLISERQKEPYVYSTKKAPEVHAQSKAVSGISRKQDSLLMLVNKSVPLAENYNPELRKLNNGKYVAEMMYEPLRKMLSDGSHEGLNFCIASAYRSSERQQEILDQDIRKLTSRGMPYKDAYQQVTRTVMPPGYSEHETGLAVDLTAVDNQRLDDSQELTPENQWLRENCSKYGFILRYPRGKENITNIDYESWHFRYVGKKAAREIMKNNLTLEEYLEKNF